MLVGEIRDRFAQISREQQSVLLCKRLPRLMIIAVIDAIKQQIPLFHKHLPLTKVKSNLPMIIVNYVFHYRVEFHKFA
jgi:hypothetical protein